MRVSGVTVLVGLGLAAAGVYVLTRKETPAFKPVPPPPPRLPVPETTTLARPLSPSAPVVPASFVPASPAVVSLDPTLTSQEREAVLYALTRETDPQKLLGFAASWGSSAPITTTLLRSKAFQILQGQGVGS
jgi:hypothetical protein